MTEAVYRAVPNAIISSRTGNEAILARSATWAGDHLGPWTDPTDWQSLGHKIKFILKREGMSGLKTMDKEEAKLRSEMRSFIWLVNHSDTGC